jgi:tetratricopeptide (TPR) repeat protein
VLSEPEVAAAFERCRGLSQRHGASPARARALHGLWWVQFARGELAQARLLALEMLERAARDGDAALQLAGSSAMGLTLAMTGELEGAQAHLESVLTQYADVGDRLAPENFIQDPGVEARSYLVVILWWRGHPAAARRMAAEAQARAARLRHPMSQLIALHLSAVMHYLAGEHARGLALVDELYEVIGRYGLPTAPGSFSWLHGHMLAALGQVDEGLAEMHAAEASCHRMGLRVGTTGFHLHLAEACREAGRSAEALAAAQAGLAIGEERGERFLLAPLHRVLAEVQRDSGDLAAARVSVQAALTLAVETGARFHEGEALVCGLRAPALLPEHARARLAALLDEGALDDSVLGAQARALLARPTPGGAAADGTTGAAP